MLMLRAFTYYLPTTQLFVIKQKKQDKDIHKVPSLPVQAADSKLVTARRPHHRCNCSNIQNKHTTRHISKDKRASLAYLLKLPTPKRSPPGAHATDVIANSLGEDT
jgi:hypothetical protein